MKRYLILADGTVFTGQGFGMPLTTTGEIVFNTGMTGYQETITDQSYNGQIIAFTAPLIGNHGINRSDYESIAPTCKGVIVNELNQEQADISGQMSLDEFLKRRQIPGISGIDTRALVRRLRQAGTMKASIVDTPDEHAFDQLHALVMPKNQVQQVSTTKPYPSPGEGRNVVVIDLGLKYSLLRELTKRQCNLIVLPYNTKAQTVLDLAPDGVIFSDGPGDPRDVPEALAIIQGIQGKIPLFGVCLGHQLLALANGAEVYKMTYGHRGANHPVREIATGKIDFTTQNHGYAVVPQSIRQAHLLVTHIDVNDQTIEGLRHRNYPAFSVQFLPNASPGPHDAAHLFDEFIEMIDAFAKRHRNSTLRS